MRPESGVSSLSFSSTSIKLFSSPCTNGAFIDTWRPDIFMVSTTSSGVTSSTSANSSGEGSRWNFCSSSENVLDILFNEPTRFRGKRTMRDCFRQCLHDGLTDPPNGIGR